MVRVPPPPKLLVREDVFARAKHLSIDEIEPASATDWDAERRRPIGSALPAGLWEFMVPTSDEAQLARRPLAISVEDNIDLGKWVSDDTDPDI